MTTSTVRVLVALDVPADQAADLHDLRASVAARLADEAGYLNSGDPITPTDVVVAVVDDSTILTESDLRGLYEVGVEGVGE